MLKKHTEKVLMEFGEAVKQQALQNLRPQNVSKELADSIKYDVKVTENALQFTMEMAEHGFYQDEGVKGFKSSNKAPNSRFKFKGVKGNGNGISKGILSWTRMRGIQFRDRKGRFLSYLATSKIISRSVYNTGIKPSRFMTKALEKEFKTLPNEIIEAYGLDLDDFLQFAFKDNIKSVKK